MLSRIRRPWKKHRLSSQNSIIIAISFHASQKSPCQSRKQWVRIRNAEWTITRHLLSPRRGRAPKPTPKPENNQFRLKRWPKLVRRYHSLTPRKLERRLKFSKPACPPPLFWRTQTLSENSFSTQTHVGKESEEDYTRCRWRTTNCIPSSLFHVSWKMPRPAILQQSSSALDWYGACTSCSIMLIEWNWRYTPTTLRWSRYGMWKRRSTHVYSTGHCYWIHYGTRSQSSIDPADSMRTPTLYRDFHHLHLCLSTSTSCTSTTTGRKNYGMDTSATVTLRTSFSSLCEKQLPWKSRPLLQLTQPFWRRHPQPHPTWQPMRRLLLQRLRPQKRRTIKLLRNTQNQLPSNQWRRWMVPSC